MRGWCMKCKSTADFIDLNTGACEHCISTYGAKVVESSRLVSRQSSAGATKAAVVQAIAEMAKDGGVQ